MLNAEVPYPPRGGSKIRTYHLVRYLARHHDVTVLAFAYAESDWAAIDTLKQICNVVPVIWRPSSIDNAMSQSGPWGARFLYWRHLLLSHKPFIIAFFDLPEVHRCVAELYARIEFDVIHAETTYMAQFLPTVSGIARQVIGLQNIEWLRHWRVAERAHGVLDRLSGYWEAYKVKRWEINALQHVDLACAVSTSDAKVVRTMTPGTPVLEVPNGVDATEFSPWPGYESVNPELVFTGTLSYPPNAEGILHFHEAILPRLRKLVPDVHLTVVGQDPPPAVQALDGASVTVTGTVPDVRPYLAEAQVVIVPLLQGAGTRLKILEALAMGKAVVSTSIGAEGLNLINGQELLIADEPHKFTAVTAELLDDPARRRLLGEAGRAKVAREYDWSRIGAMLEEGYLNLVAGDGRLPSTKNSRVE
jgi:sugar transferase (PEP-CTERM/EpsH1 system associated)